MRTLRSLPVAPPCWSPSATVRLSEQATPSALPCPLGSTQFYPLPRCPLSASYPAVALAVYVGQCMGLQV
jgi:hypothetical protein